MTKRYRLAARAQMHGALREPGYEFTLADGELGPHKGVSVTHDKVDNDPANGIDANRMVGKAIDVPLYEEIKENDDHQQAAGREAGSQAARPGED